MSERTRSARGLTLQHLREYPHRTIAIVYDFDGTLSPLSMQDYTVFPELGIDPQSFWSEVKTATRANQATEVLTYMRLMAERIAQGSLPINRDRLRELGGRVPYFSGVETWFDRINKFVHYETLGYVKVRHYIVSAGLKEILDGVSIARHFHTIYASQYHFDVFGRPTFPNRVITDVSKTQYLFRINKGVEDLSLPVNDHMPEAERPIPFRNIIYIGDGDTDVPSMAVTRKNGGHAFAVYSPGENAAKCDALFRAGRVDAFFEANYSQNTRLEIFFKGLLRKIFAEIRYDSMLHLFKEYRAS
ncbi:HAD family hydrolase [Bradyrhizobium oligotrophicum]|uniref:HAD family hydrolase n=1 Tax=Bradyrhizobium oligotrophicum TaxID=44255 RepID=UPI003EBED58A